MTINDAKAVAIEEILFHFGLRPTYQKRSGEELWYHSPFREENTPSFKVTVSKNLYYDFGEGEGGNSLSLVIRLVKTDFGGALSWLRQMKGELNMDKPRVSQRPIPKKEKNEKNPLVFIRKKPLSNTALVDYLKHRCIDIVIAKKYAVEVYYKNTRNNKRYFGIGCKNISGGYAVRNKYYKSMVGKTDISFVKGDIGSFKTSGPRMDIFEGFFDLLAHRSINRYFPNNDAIVLNSTSHFKKAIELINGSDYKEITLWQDNDTAGSKLLKSFKEAFGEMIYIRSQSHLYPEHNDLNAYWKDLLQQREQFL
jgi:DNA primase